MKRTLTAVLAIVPAMLISEGAIASASGAEPIGLSLFFRDGSIRPIDLVGDSPRFLQEIDITASATSMTDQGISPLIQASELSGLDWRGIHFVEEDWRSPGDGTFTRQRFYRGARWMERSSAFVVLPKDNRGRLAGEPLLFIAGSDDDATRADDGFVRRFEVRQTTLGCRAIGDCSGATSFIAQGLVQARAALHPEQRAGNIGHDASQLQLIWSEDFLTNRSVALTHSSPGQFEFGYGFQPAVEVVTPPANGQFYLPGDAVSFKLLFRDGAGRRLTPEGSLPTYAEFMSGQAPSGLHFLDLTINPTLYYALKHREGNMLFALSGPTDKLKNPFDTIDISQFFMPQVTVATASGEGWSGVAEVIPPLPEIIGGFQDPGLWEAPNSDVRTLVIPSDAQPGTYVAAIKARREWGGEALNRGATATIQVGSPTPTAYQPKTGRCNNCHEERSSLGVVNHGLGDRSACFGCHASLSFEPDNALDFRVHFVHSRSDRFPGNVNQCSTCHLDRPNGPPRGFPGVGL